MAAGKSVSSAAQDQGRKFSSDLTSQICQQLIDVDLELRDSKWKHIFEFKRLKGTQPNKDTQ
ncbi:hypothetical protein Vi05172_g237 [Venturia inaequalis]|nr:hypothetical protein Vi05172_g237 [Venturia inaequalis]